MTCALELHRVSKVYGSGPSEVHALSEVDLSVERGELVAVMGPSGSGKSTLLTIAGSLEEPSSGEVLVDGVDLATVSHADRATMRRRSIGYVFQDFNLLPGLTAVENAALPLELDGIGAKAARATGLKALEALDVAERADRYPDELSGGERQRVAIARAIVGERGLLLADEPTGALDSVNGEASCACCGPPPSGVSRVSSSRTRRNWRPGPTASSSCATASSSTRRSRLPARTRCSPPLIGGDDARHRAPRRTAKRRRRRPPRRDPLGRAHVPARVAAADPGGDAPHRRGRGGGRQHHDRLQREPRGQRRVRLGQSPAQVRRSRSAKARGGSGRRPRDRSGRRRSSGTARWSSPAASRRSTSGRRTRPAPTAASCSHSAAAATRRAPARSPSPTVSPSCCGSRSGRPWRSTAGGGRSSASSRTRAS